MGEVRPLKRREKVSGGEEEEKTLTGELSKKAPAQKEGGNPSPREKMDNAKR